MPLVKIMPLKDFRATALSTSGSGTAKSSDAPVSGQKLYAGLHLTQVSTGRSFVGLIQSASSSGFGSVTNEITFALTSERGSTWKETSTLSTDRPWRRFSWTLSTAGGSTGGSWKGLSWMGLR